MPRDLLAALRETVPLEETEGQDNLAFEIDLSEEGHDVIQMETLGPHLAFDEVKEFLEETWRMLREFKDKIHPIRLEHEKILTTVNPDDSTKQELELLQDDMKMRTKDIRSRLKLIDNRIKEDELEIQDSDGSAVKTEIRMRKSQLAALSKTFTNTIDEYQVIQTEHRDKCKGRIRRQIEIAGGDISEEQIEEMIEQGNWTAFGQSIIQETEQARQMLEDVKLRHNELLQLEKAIMELHELFMEMVILVESQGQMIDRIETHVQSAQEYTEASVVVLKKAIRLQRSARKKQICIIVTVIIVVIVLALIIYFSVPKG